MNNNDLVDIVYSETIDSYVIILKRFPNMPVIINTNLEDIEYYCNDDELNRFEIYDFRYSNNNIFYGLELIKIHSKCYVSNIFSATHDKCNDIIDRIPISIKERNEIINKVIETLNMMG